MLRAFSVFVMTALVASVAWAATVSGPAPGFTLESRDGQQVSLASLKGKVVMVNFWATWCVPCREEFPFLTRLQKKHRGAGLSVLGVSTDFQKEKAAVEKFLGT